MRSPVAIFGALILVGALGSHARAQPAAEETKMSSLPFASLERVDGTNGFNVNLAMIVPIDDLDGVGFRLGGLYQHTTASGLGGYANMPFAVVFGNGDSELGIGAFEACGLYAKRKGEVGFVLRGGLTAPIASDGSGALANFVAAYARPGDLALAAPETLWLRTAASGILYTGGALVRLDLGIDVPISGVDENLFHFGIGVAGAPKGGGPSWAVELSVASGGGVSIKTLAAGVTWGGGNFVGLLTPLGEFARGELLIATLSLRGPAL